MKAGAALCGGKREVRRNGSSSDVFNYSVEKRLLVALLEQKEILG